MSSANDAIPILPACGLYKTGAPVPGHERAVPEDRLVYFHNHSEQGPPILLVPAHNRHNKWHFDRRGYLVTDADYPATLVPLRAEGLYRVREHFHPNADQVVARSALVQLGYTTTAEPILFFPTTGEDDNALRFPERGMKVGAAIYDLLEPLDLRGPHRQQARQLH